MAANGETEMAKIPTTEGLDGHILSIRILVSNI